MILNDENANMSELTWSQSYSVHRRSSNNKTSADIACSRPSSCPGSIEIIKKTTPVRSSLQSALKPPEAPEPAGRRVKRLKKRLRHVRPFWWIITSDSKLDWCSEFGRSFNSLGRVCWA